MVRAHLFIRGLVQGVYFRASTQREAERLGITGWVRNCPTGAVEVVAEGEKDSVEKLLAWCHHGPSGALVRHVETNWEEPSDQEGRFFIRHEAST